MTNRSYVKFQNSKSNSNSKSNPNPKPKFKKVTPKNIVRFQLWNTQKFTWDQKLLRQQPTLLKEREVIHWQNFRTQKLHFGQLYLWHATATEWVPLWSLESGFFLINSNFIRYSDVSLEQFTNTKWIELNAIDVKYIKQLLAIFNITMDTFADIPVLNKRQTKTNSQTIAGSPFWISNPRPQLGPPIYREDIRRWQDYCIFNKHDQRFMYDFVKYYHITYLKSNSGIGRVNVTGFNQAAQQAKNDNAYIYQKNNMFIQ